MDTDVFLFQYGVLGEYRGRSEYPFRKGNRVAGTLAFNFENGAVRLSVSIPGEPLQFTYLNWDSFELEWTVLDRS
jgi:hypothetical protein